MNAYSLYPYNTSILQYLVRVSRYVMQHLEHVTTHAFKHLHCFALCVISHLVSVSVDAVQHLVLVTAYFMYSRRLKRHTKLQFYSSQIHIIRRCIGTKAFFGKAFQLSFWCVGENSLSCCIK